MTVAPGHSPYSKDNPFAAVVTEARLLNKPGSGKETRHFAIDLSGSGLTYKSGDSLGVFPSNRPAEVEEVIRRLGATGEEPVAVPRVAEPLPLRVALTKRLALAGPTRKFVQALASLADGGGGKARLDGLLAPEANDHLTGYLKEREFVDLLAEFPGIRLRPQLFVDHLRRLMPRLYSIASAPAVHPSEAHLMVAVVRYTTNGRDRVGVASTYLADRIELGATRIPVFVAASHFGLSGDGGADAIMVGPGTGVAPFRAFLQERAATRAAGRNWLFFGEQHQATDFLYEEDWRRFLDSGVLTRLDTAFSRDQERKIYVQDRMREAGAELWAWIRAGAFFYVCGDAHRMAKDVDAALQEIVAAHGGMTPAEAADYVKRMRQDRRYQRDVY